MQTKRNVDILDEILKDMLCCWRTIFTLAEFVNHRIFIFLLDKIAPELVFFLPIAINIKRKGKSMLSF